MLTVGFAQFAPARKDVAANVATTQALLEGVHADVLVLPELANSGYLYASPADLAPYAEDGSGQGPFLSALIHLAAQIDGLLVTGFAEKGLGGLYNSAAAVDSSGVVHVYRKTHLFAGERDLFLPGDTGFRVFEFRGARIGIMICFDWFFPESARTLALLGAQILAHPANLVLPYCQKAMVTRSLENSVFSITANRTGSETLGDTTLTFTGRSQIVDARGQHVIAATEEENCIRLGKIEPAAADDKAIGPSNNWVRDRRPESYAGSLRNDVANDGQL